MQWCQEDQNVASPGIHILNLPPKPTESDPLRAEFKVCQLTSLPDSSTACQVWEGWSWQISRYHGGALPTYVFSKQTGVPFNCCWSEKAGGDASPLHPRPLCPLCPQSLLDQSDKEVACYKDFLNSKNSLFQGGIFCSINIYAFNIFFIQERTESCGRYY